MNLINKYILSFSIIVLVLLSAGESSSLFAVTKPLPDIQFQIAVPDKISGGETSKAKVYIQRTEENKKDEFVFRLETNNPSLGRFPVVQEVKIELRKSSVEFDFHTAPTLIKTNATIRAVLQNSNSQAENSIEIVPALLKSVTSQPSMIGTHGAKVEITVELRAKAPPGGIEIYPSRLFVSNLSNRFEYQFPNLRVPAGSAKFSFFIEYDWIWVNGIRVSSSVDTGERRSKDLDEFNSQKRTVEIYLSLEPGDKTPNVVPGITDKARFDVIPLQVTLISAQPNAITGGSEALGNFTLNASPGNGEKIYLRPIKVSGQTLWTKPLGSSCNAAGDGMDGVEIPLTQGVTSYNFKICTSSVSAGTPKKITANLRSGRFETSVTVQP